MACLEYADEAGGAEDGTTGEVRRYGMLEILKNRFLANPMRHKDVTWEEVERRLCENRKALDILRRMEESGGEPDTIGFEPDIIGSESDAIGSELDTVGSELDTIGSEPDTRRLIFCDCSKESPAGRRSLCYDDAALYKRKNNPPVGSAVRQAQ